MTGPKEIALENRAQAGERLFSPSTARNRDALKQAFLEHMPRQGEILEIASGTGEHAVHIANASPTLNWTPSDPDQKSRRSITAWRETAQHGNIHQPLNIDVTSPEWTEKFPAKFQGMACINMVHIAPFEAARGLFAGAARLINPGGRLFLYGPFSRKGVHSAPSNAEFDASLKARDPRWGVRDLDHDIAPLAEKAGMEFIQIVDMPANNLSVIFQRR